MEDRLEPLLAAHAWALPPRQVVAELDVLAGWMAQAQAAFLARVRELDVQGLFRVMGPRRRRCGCVTGTGWRCRRPGSLCGWPPTSTVHPVRCGAVRDAVATGEVNLEQAQVIVAAIKALPRNVELRDLAGKELVRLAGEYEPAELKRAGETILRVVDPDAADEVERKALERAEAGAHERRGFTVSRDRSGVGYRISGHVTDVGAAVIRAAIEPLANPTQPAPPRPARTAPPAMTARPGATAQPGAGLWVRCCGGVWIPGRRRSVGLTRWSTFAGWR